MIRRPPGGDKLWQSAAQSGIVAAPISYRAGGLQHIAVAAGWGTVFALAGGEIIAALGNRNVSRILAFRLGGTDSLPVVATVARPAVPEPPERLGDVEVIAAGKTVYYERCWVCHGDGAASGGITSDLRYSIAQTYASWDAFVIGGAASASGMPGFAGVLSTEDSSAVRAYVIDRAWLAFERQQASVE